MARRPTRGNAGEIWRRLRDIVGVYGVKLESAKLREQVQGLVEIHQLLRGLGSSLIQGPGTNAGRARILIYLRENCGQIIAGDQLMVVSGINDYPRRIRELRKELGWKILSGITAKEMREDAEAANESSEGIPKMKPDDYFLLSPEPDLEAAARWKTANTIRRLDKGVKSKLLDYFRTNVGQEISGEELKYVAKDSGDWPRRVRELRTEEGWPIATRQTGRPELPVGAYLLEADHQAPTHDRKIQDETRAEAYKRDGYKCRGILGNDSTCGWHHNLWKREDPRFLELHHVEYHVEGGSNEVDNLITLCNLCHDRIHREGG
jgi:hypothetical protein